MEPHTFGFQKFNARQLFRPFGNPAFFIENTGIRLALDVYYLFHTPFALVSRLFPITALPDLASILLSSPSHPFRPAPRTFGEEVQQAVLRVRHQLEGPHAAQTPAPSHTRARSAGLNSLGVNRLSLRYRDQNHVQHRHRAAESDDDTERRARYRCVHV